MDTSQIIRLPKKYGELFTSMTNDEAGKLIKCLFSLDECNNLEGLTKTYYNIIKVDLDNLEKSAVNGKKGGRPKVRKTPGYEKEKPQVIESDNLKERERVNKDKVKEKEKKNKYGEYKNILLTLSEKDKLIKDYGESTFNKYIIILDEGIEMKGYKYKSHNLAIRNWINRDNIKKDEGKKSFEKSGETNWSEGL